MHLEPFSIKKRLLSFKFALNGLKILLIEEHNSRIHLFVAILAMILGLLLKISSMEWIALCFAIGVVISFEIVNSAIENLADFSSPHKNDLIKKIKDLSAAAVLVSTITAVIIGLIIFLPKLIVYVR